MMKGGMPQTDTDIKLVLRPLKSEGKTVSATNAAAPAEAREAYGKALQSIAKRSLPEARKELGRAVEIYPKFASAWFELGKIQMDGSEPAPARESFAKALEADPKYLPPYDRLSMLALHEQKWQELADITNRLIEAGAFDYPQAYYYNAQANFSLNHLDQAEKSAREALKQDPRKLVRANYLLGLIFARRNEFGLAAEELKIYLASSPTDAAPIQKQLSDFEARAKRQAPAPAQ
jgi:tetratricopeptide (TPR) repeat protein